MPDIASGTSGPSSAGSDLATRAPVGPSRMLEHIAIAVYGVGLDGLIRSVSAGIRAITGLCPKDYAGRTWDEVTHPEDVGRAANVLSDLANAPDGTRRTVRVRTMASEGRWAAVEIEVTRCLDDPEVAMYVATMRGVAALDDEPDRQEAFLKSVISVAADALLIVDERWQLRWASPSAAAFSGWSTELLQSKSAADLVHPDDIEAVLHSASVMMGEIDGETEAVECRVLQADGSWRWMRLGGADLRDVEGVGGIVVVVTDVQETVEAREAQVASERRFEALVRHSHDGIIVTNHDGETTYVSPAITRILGWDTEMVLAAPHAVGIPEPDRTRLLEAERRAIADPSGPQMVQVRMPHADGGYRWMELALWDRSDAPEVGGVVCNYRDVTEQRRLVAELEERNEILGSLAFSSTTGLFEQDSINDITRVNERFLEIVGLTEAECLGDGWRRVIDSAEIDPNLGLGVAPVGQEAPIRVRIVRGDGEHRWVDIRSSILPPDRSGVIRRVGGIEDVNAMVEAETGRERLAGVFDLSDDIVVLVSPDGVILYTNRAAREVLGDDLGQLADRDDLAEATASVMDPGGGRSRFRWGGEVTLTSVDGRRVPVSLEVLAHHNDDGTIDYLSIVGRDISERIALELSLEQQATHDPLTGLPNRTLLLDRVRRATDHEVLGAGGMVALLFIDLDHFKVINDSLGHSLGDLLLQAIASRILTVVRPGDTVARFGGDEFVVLCEHVENQEDALAVAHRVETTLQAPFGVDGHDIHVGVSIGIAFADEEADPEAILRDADTAMYEAKSAGRGRWVVFDDELRRVAVARQRIESALRASRDGADLELHYQPVLDLRSRAIRGVEALLRWRRGSTLVAPENFVSVAEETGLIVPIGKWVLTEACRQGAQWQQLPGWSDLGMSVNVSARQLQRPGFVATVAEVLASSGLVPGTLTLEITETVLLEDEAMVVDVLQSLREMGVHVAVDDFGTGYSSLTYLHKLPVDTVKLDRSFVAGVADDLQKRAIVTAVINLTKALGLQSVAEGVETERQLAELRMLGCTAGQGHLISAAVQAEEIEAFLANGLDA